MFLRNIAKICASQKKVVNLHDFYTTLTTQKYFYMKKHIFLFAIAVLSCLQLSAQSSNNASPKHEFRATWFATVTNIDWPTATNLTVDQQKAELRAILDKLQAGNINAVCLQVRSQGDALYKSSYEPWAVALTGTRGKDPGYDPLEYAIQEAHKRGMELHAWVNPFRISTTEGGRLTEEQVENLYHGLSWSWVLTYDNGTFTGQIIDPGYPAAREYIKNVVMEIVDKYDIDGILMDDYFYPYGGTTTEDAVSKGLYKPNDVKDINGDGNTDDDWRRSNVDALVKLIYDELNTGANKKPWVRFGLAPFGVWTVQPKAAAAYGISLPNGISGQDCYEQLACNPIEWIKNGYIDYVSPQLYWPTATSPNDYRRAQDYHILYNWWSDICTQFAKELPGDQVVQFYPSHSADRVYDSHQWGSDEMRTQVGYNQKKLTHGYSGSVFFSTRYYLNLKNAKGEYICGTLDSTLCEQLHASHYQHKALVPPMAWKSTEELDAPNTLRISGKTLTWKHDDANVTRFTVYIYPKGVRMSQAIEDVSYLQSVVYGKSFTLPDGFDVTTHNVAVRSYDRYGVEHAAAEYGPDVIYVLNGGELEYTDEIEVPTNEELWEAFKVYYKTFYNENRGDQPITLVATFMTQGEKIMTDETSEYKWLGDYLLKVANEQIANGTLTTYTGITTEVKWRFATQAFFNCSAAVDKDYSGNPDFTEAGKQENWKNAYIAAHTQMNIPTQPTQEELWADFKTDAGITTLGTLAEITAAGADKPHNDGNNQCACRIICAKLTDGIASEILAKSKWTWLKTYILGIQTDLPTNLSGPAWKYAVAAFFLQSQHSAYPTSANFSTAGQPSAWEAAWRAVNQGTTADPETSVYTLPDFIETEFTLPTASSNPKIYHPSGYTFLGWKDSNGADVTTLSIGYKGTVYAQWDSPIKWVLNGGVYTGDGELPLHVHEGEEYYLPTANYMHKEGYKLVGWYKTSDFSDDALISITSIFEGTLYAKWGEATHVTWHPYPYYDVTNENLWELFVEDYNAFYTNKEILGENNVSSGEKDENISITGAFGFTFSLNADKGNFPDGRAKDFMTHPQSPWKWLGDYIVETIEAGKGSEDSNEPLWSAFKEATGLTNLSTLKNYEEKGTGFTSIAGALNGEKLTTLFADEKWACLKSYIMTVQNAVKGTVLGQTTNSEGKLVDITIIELKSTIADSERAWCYAVAAFFLQDQRKVWPASADFYDAGKHTIWMEAIEQMGTEAAEEFHELGHFRISSEKEWRKQIAGFFNHSDFIKYEFPIGSGDSILEETADFRVSGLPRPNGDPTKGWYNAWWNATFPEYMIDKESLPRIKHKGYLFGGWYYGNEKGYIFTEGTKADPASYSANTDYKNHLWGRWLELCLYEGYVDSDPAALGANGLPISPKVNNNYELASCSDGKSHKIDVERKLVGGAYNTMFLPFGINGQGSVQKDDNGNYIPGSGKCGKRRYLEQVVDDQGNKLLDPDKTSILVFDNATVETVGGEDVISFNFHEYAETDSLETLGVYQPILIKPENDITTRMHFWSALMWKPATPKARTDASQANVEGALAPTMLPINSEYDNTLILVADNRLAKVTTPGELLGLRVYFTVPNDASPTARSIIRVKDAPTEVENINTPQQGAAAIKVLRDGTIYILRDSKVYTITGNRVQ